MTTPASLAAQAGGILWSSAYPASGDVTIPAGKKVVLDRSVDLTSLTVNGTLVGDDQDLTLRSRWIMVDGGTLRIGSEAQPFRHQLDLQLTGSDPGQDVMGMGTKLLGAMGSATVEIHGQPKLSWTKLAAGARPGQTQLRLTGAVNWSVGDRVVVAPSDFDPHEAEERTVTAVSGSTLTLDRPLAFGHWGEAPQAYGKNTLDMRAEVALLSRNVHIRGVDNATVRLHNTITGRDADGIFGGHMMFMKGTLVKLSDIEVSEMGQQGAVGRYPVHWHLAGDVPAGSYLKNSVIHDTFQRGLVLHQTNKLLIQNNVVYNTVGHQYFLESGTERDNRFEHNLGLLTRYVPTVHRLSLPSQDDPGGAERAERQAAFWITNTHNVFKDNVAAAVENGWGFIFADIDKSEPLISPYDPVKQLPMLEFSGNVAHSISFERSPGGERGVFNLGYGPEEAGSCFRFDNVPYIGTAAAENASVTGATAYKCRNTAFWASNFKPILGSVVADSRSVITNNQGVQQASVLQDSAVVARTANNPADRANYDSGPFRGPVLFETLESGPVRYVNTLVSGAFQLHGGTPGIDAPASTSAPGFRLRPLTDTVNLTAGSDASVTVQLDRAGGYTGPVTVQLLPQSVPNESHWFDAVSAEPLTIAAGSSSGTLTLRAGANATPGDGPLTLATSGDGTTRLDMLDVSTASAPVAVPAGQNLGLQAADGATMSNREFNRSASFALDGDRTTFSHASGTQPWWQVDLGQTYHLGEIRLWTAAGLTGWNCCAPAFSDFYVLVSAFPSLNGAQTLAEALKLPGVSGYHVANAIGSPSLVKMNPGQTGRFVRVWWAGSGDMQLSEVEIMSGP